MFLLIGEIDKVLKKVRPKITAILRTQAFYSVNDLIIQYKTHVLCDLEFSSLAIFHAGKSFLAALDS